MFPLEKNKKLRVLNKKKDFEFLKKHSSFFSYKWLKVWAVFQWENPDLKVAWSLSKKQVSHSVVRNRLKRWGRENLRGTHIRGMMLFVFSSYNDRYKNLKRKDFDNVFRSLLDQIQKKA